MSNKIVIILSLLGAIVIGGIFCLISFFMTVKTQNAVTEPKLNTYSNTAATPGSYVTLVNICDYAGENATWALQTSGPATRHTQAQNEPCFQEKLVMPTLGEETLIIYRCLDSECTNYKSMYFENMPYLFQGKSEITLTVTYKKDSAGKGVFSIDQAK